MGSGILGDGFLSLIFEGGGCGKLGMAVGRGAMLINAGARDGMGFCLSLSGLAGVSDTLRRRSLLAAMSPQEGRLRRLLLFDS